MSGYRITLLSSVCTLALALFGASVYAQSWQTQLQDGSQVQVDTQSNKATVSRGGVQAPLWNGVHRLENGSTVTIREGVMVPNTEVVEAKRSPWHTSGQPFVVDGPSACGILQRKVCGLQGECGDSSPCAFARQLISLEEEEVKERETGKYASAFQMTQTQCQEALIDEGFFPTCTTRQRGSSLTTCEHLVHKVCGAGNQCQNRPGCKPARQLAEMEYIERLKSMDPKNPTYSTGKCSQALIEDNFFTACGL
ncbi:MAG: hypothetical protein GY731_09540 [Gammaproteobacteria bacterium]|nr:hypothetical protein [Gammaproteobacteria bacterium]